MVSTIHQKNGHFKIPEKTAGRYFACSYPQIYYYWMRVENGRLALPEKRFFITNTGRTRAVPNGFQIFLKITL
jgi:hypothetical protein